MPRWRRRSSAWREKRGGWPAVVRWASTSANDGPVRAAVALDAGAAGAVGVTSPGEISAGFWTGELTTLVPDRSGDLADARRRYPGVAVDGERRPGGREVDLLDDAGAAVARRVDVADRVAEQRQRLGGLSGRGALRGRLRGVG